MILEHLVGPGTEPVHLQNYPAFHGRLQCEEALMAHAIVTTQVLHDAWGNVCSDMHREQVNHQPAYQSE